MESNKLQEEGGGFIKVFRFISDKVSSIQISYLYSLLRNHRLQLIKSGKLKGYDEWFYYPADWLEEAIKRPNSVNHVTGLLKELRSVKLIDFKCDSVYPFTRRIKINDELFYSLSATYMKGIEAARKKKYEDKRLSSGKTDEQMQEIEEDDDIDFLPEYLHKYKK